MPWVAARSLRQHPRVPLSRGFVTLAGTGACGLPVDLEHTESSSSVPTLTSTSADLLLCHQGKHSAKDQDI